MLDERDLVEVVRQRTNGDKLDLAGLNLNRFPSAYPLTIHQLHLKNNDLVTLPGSMFADLVNLVWLDLRNNKLTTLPSEIGMAPSLKELLLAGNVLRELPVELSRVKTLRGMQLQPNPLLISPPVEIVQQGFKTIMKFLGELDVDQAAEEIDIETDIGTKLDTMSLGRSSINTAEYTQSYQNKILPISLRNPMSLSQYQDAMDKHLKAEEKTIRDKEWSALTEEDKLDLEVEKTIIDKELQRRHDQMELEKFRRKPVERRNPAETTTAMERIMDHETNQKEQAKADAVKGANYECGEVSILPHKSTNKESILDKYLHLEKNKKSFI